MDKKSKSVERKGRMSNGILKKQTLLNNNNIVKNLNDVKKPSTLPKVTPKKKIVPPPAPPEPDLPQGCTPLMYACQQADEKLVSDILKKEPSSVLKRDRTLKTALHYCFDNPNAATADRIVMAAPILLEARDQDGFTPLHLAVIQGNMPLVTFLLANNADVMAMDNEKHSVVHWATVCGELEALRAVLSAGADPSTADIHGGYPLHYAAQMCGGASAGAGGARLSLEVLATLLRAVTKVDALDGQGRQPLLWAASAGSAPAILSLVKAGAAVEAADKDGLTALHCAASRGHTECIETLLSLCGARPDVIDSNGCTALHYAVTLGHADATMLLLDHGSDPNRQDRKGRSPAHCGCAKGQLETVRMLGAKGANIWLRNAKGDLPLHEAVASGRRELVKWLLEIRPSQVNATNNDGRTLLHIAANTDNTDLCKIILDFGGEINSVLRTSKNILMTPLDCALHKGYRSTAKYLQMHGGLPASRLSSKNVKVNQETIPQLPVRHIKSTKINLRDNIAIERREIFEMSPGSTPKHRYSGKGSAMESSSEESSEDYETENKRKREERRKHKKHSFRYKKDKYKANQNSFSDGYEGEIVHRKRSSRPEKSLSDSEGSGQVLQRKKKRSKSEPTEKSPKGVKSKYAEAKNVDNKTSSQGSEVEKKYKKRRKTSSLKRKSELNTSSDSNKIDVLEVDKKSKPKYKEKKKQEKEETSKIDDSKVNDIIENIENNLNKLDHVIESRLSDNENNTLSFIQTTLVTEAQVHMESRTSIDKDFNEYKAVTIETYNKSDDSESKKDKISELAIEYTIKDEAENNDANISDEYKTGLVEQHAEIREEKIESEIINDLPPRDGIIAIIPDIEPEDINNLNQTEESQKSDEAVVDSEKTEENYVQAIMGIIEDEEQHSSQDAKDSPDSIMGDEVVNELEQPGDDKAIILIDSQIKDTDIDRTNDQYEQNDSEELIGVREISFKSKDNNVENIENENPDYSDDKIEGAGPKKTVTHHASFQKQYPGGQKVKRKSSSQSLDSADSNNTYSKTTGKELYETQSYKVLSERFEGEAEEFPENTRQAVSALPTDGREIDDANRFVKQGKYSRRRMPSVSDNEMYNIIDSSGGVRRRRLRKKYRENNRNSTTRSKSQNSDRDYESSFFVDSGFEPSPRFIHQNRPMSPRLVAYYEDRNASGDFNDKTVSTKIPKRKPGDKNAVDMKSVTQIVQTNMRRYFLERKIFQHLMDLKRIQIRSSKANEAMLVKRAIDEYHRSSLVHVGAGRYSSNDFTFKSFEKFLYDSLRKLQKSGGRHLANLPEKAFPDFDGRIAENFYKTDGLPDNPILCTNKTHRCYHAVHAYTGIPCSAYIPMKYNHHTMPKPESKRASSFLPEIKGKSGKKHNSQVTLELCHGNEKQMIALPAEKLNKNKRYYVTFTVKGSNQNSDSENKSSDNAQRNVKSV